MVALIGWNDLGRLDWQEREKIRLRTSSSGSAEHAAFGSSGNAVANLDHLHRFPLSRGECPAASPALHGVPRAAGRGIGIEDSPAAVATVTG
jgi:hypothetical protein